MSIAQLSPDSASTSINLFRKKTTPLSEMVGSDAWLLATWTRLPLQTILLGYAITNSLFRDTESVINTASFSSASSMVNLPTDASGYQSEVPDYWLTAGNPWVLHPGVIYQEIERLDVSYDVMFRGHVSQTTDSAGEPSYVWHGNALDNTSRRRNGDCRGVRCPNTRVRYKQLHKHPIVELQAMQAI